MGGAERVVKMYVLWVAKHWPCLVFAKDISKKLGDDKSLEEHLQLPIQRINDYQLLLKVRIHTSNILLSACLEDEESSRGHSINIPTDHTQYNKRIKSFLGWRSY